MKLAYRDYGSGQPLIILHGLFGQSDNWNTLGKQFAENGLHVFLVDQRNHGLSPHSEEWSYEVMADDLHEFIGEHRLKNPILLGHSMGAKTVLYFEKQYQGDAEKLLIADMAARKYEHHHREVLEALKMVDFSKIQKRGEAEEVLKKYIQDNGTIQFLLKNIYWKEQEPSAMDWRFNLAVIDKNYENIVAAVPAFRSETPVLILKGEKSRYVQEKDVADYRERFSNCSIETISDAGHWLHAEKPQDFFNAVMAFIKA